MPAETWRRLHQVAAGAAAEFEDGAARRHGKAVDQPVAAEQIIFAGEIVDVALVAVDAVHQIRMAVHPPRSCHAPPAFT